MRSMHPPTTAWPVFLYLYRRVRHAMAYTRWAFRVEHGVWAYRLDFGFYGLAVLGLAAGLWLAAPVGQRWGAAWCVLLGLASWTGLEYGFHRFALHGVTPFARLHALHHARPRALICTPTLVSAGLIVGLVFLPALWLSNGWLAGGLTLGIVAGYLAYSVIHHATHHWRARSGWLVRRKRWHALHHHAGSACCFGVSTGVWDYVFGSVPPKVLALNSPIPPCPLTPRRGEGEL